MPETLPAPSEWKAVLGFDFDDTLVLKHGSVPLDPAFFDRIKTIRHDYGTAWGIATGRSLHQLIEGFVEHKFPFLPDFVVARERELYYPGQLGRWLPDEEWNLACEKEHHRLFKKSKRVLSKIRKFVEKRTEARWVSVEGDAAGLVATSDDEMEVILKYVESLPRSGDLTYERNSIYLRFSHREYNKGAGLLQAALRWDIAPDRILAVGDNFNDISMLQPQVSGACGCPSNSVPAVKILVAERGGRVGDSEGSRGVIEVLDHYFAP